jgi:hypothetical protein
MSLVFKNATYPETSLENDLSRAYTTNLIVKERTDADDQSPAAISKLAARE